MVLQKTCFKHFDDVPLTGKRMSDPWVRDRITVAKDNVFVIVYVYKQDLMKTYGVQKRFRRKKSRHDNCTYTFGYRHDDRFLFSAALVFRIDQSSDILQWLRMEQDQVRILVDDQHVEP